jgi:hypothetical protein
MSSLQVVREQLEMAREHALLGSYTTAATYYDVVLKQLRSNLAGACSCVVGQSGHTHGSLIVPRLARLARAGVGALLCRLWDRGFV